MNSLAAIILAAGKGTRMKSGRAKVTFQLAGKPMLQRVVDTAARSSCGQIFVVVGYQKESVIACLREDSRLVFVEQAEQLGTGHAVIMVQPLLPDSVSAVLILSGDVPLLRHETLERLYQEHMASGASCTVLTAFLDDAGKYGRILRNEAGRVAGIVEYKDATEEQRSIKEWNTGIYCFSARELFASLSQVKSANQQQEYYLTDVVSILQREGKIIASVVVDDLSEVAGVNSQEQLAALEDYHLDQVRRYWLNNGVMIRHPSSVYIGDEVLLEPDVEVGQNCVLKGHSSIGANTLIGPACYIEDAHIGENCLLEGLNVLRRAHLPEDSQLIFGEQVIDEEECE